MTIGSQTSHSFTVTFSGKGNSGKLAIGWSGSGRFSPGDVDQCTGVALSAKNPTCSFDILFTPDAVGTVQGSVDVESRSLISNAATLTGTGQTATASLSINSPSWCSNCSPYSITFTVTMSRPSTTPVTFNWAATDGSGTEPAAYWGTSCDGSADYTSASNTGTGSIAAGATTTTIPFGLCENGPAYGPPLTFTTKFTVTISNPSGATITTDTGTGTITIS